ncbi:hypothetical protein [Alkaliphilus transvaalensis]|uniref:hypothetical protein n=1 Tax=Alkaliphilus transvaalensis TaxID=114628 RepID=UPI000553C75F|nr:hypothetical protein [Alkaliphilus transvaalensis]
MLNENNQVPVIKDFQESYEKGFRCVFYETDERDQQFTVYLKNFTTENIKILKCNEDEGKKLKNYIDQLS